MQFVKFILDGGAVIYINPGMVTAVVEDKNTIDNYYTHIYLRGSDKYFKVRGHYIDILKELNI